MDEPLMTVPEVATWLKLKPETIRKMVREHKIPHLGIGRRAVRFKREEIEKWLETLATKPS